MTDPSRPTYLTKPAPAWMERLVGHVVLAFGTVLLGLVLLGVFGWLTGGIAVSRRTAFLAMLVVVALIGSLCTLLGVRLVAGSSRHRDSLLSRPVWMLVGTVFVALSVAGAIVLPWNSDGVVGLGCGAILAVCCFGVATRPRSR